MIPTATTTPDARPPTTARVKSQATSPTVTTAVIATIALFSVTSAVASFSRPSPSSSAAIRRGSLPLPAIAPTLTASVGARIAPNAMPAARVICGTSHQVMSPTTSAENTTRPTDRVRIESPRARTSRKDVCSAAAKSTAGSTPTSTTSGLSCTVGTPGMNAIPTPTSTSSSGADQPTRRETPVTPTTSSRAATAQATVAVKLTGSDAGRLGSRRQRTEHG